MAIITQVYFEKASFCEEPIDLFAKHASMSQQWRDEQVHSDPLYHVWSIPARIYPGYADNTMEKYALVVHKNTESSNSYHISVAPSSQPYTIKTRFSVPTTISTPSKLDNDEFLDSIKESMKLLKISDMALDLEEQEGHLDDEASAETSDMINEIKERIYAYKNTQNEILQRLINSNANVMRSLFEDNNIFASHEFSFQYELRFNTASTPRARHLHG